MILVVEGPEISVILGPQLPRLMPFQIAVGSLAARSRDVIGLQCSP